MGVQAQCKSSKETGHEEEHFEDIERSISKIEKDLVYLLHWDFINHLLFEKDVV